MSDIVERLRCGEPCLEASGINECRVKDAASGCLCAMAADEIERLRAALEEIAGYRMKGRSDADIARAALEK